MPPQTPIEALEGFTFGADPELFIIDADGNGVCPDDIIPGTKEEPFKVPGGAVQQDGMAAEFNIDPCTTFDEFNDNVQKVVRGLRKFLPKNHQLIAAPSMTFSEDVWEKASEKAKELGCSPDYNAWSESVNLPPDGSRIPRMRTAAGHLHIGWTKDTDICDITHLKNCNDLVKQFDWYLGAWSLRMDPDPVRRKLYGKAGACRYKDYGVEYRVLSNFWVMGRVERLQVWNRMQQAIWDMPENFMPEKRPDCAELLIESINNSIRNPSMEKHFYFPIVNYQQ